MGPAAARLAFSGSAPILPVVVQHHATSEVLMLGWGNAEALRRYLQFKELWF
jgi:phosphoribosyl-AMP cyclohydrolase